MPSLETESWGVLSSTDFTRLLKSFTKRFGSPTTSKRIAFSFWNHDRNSIDTRIRITDGQAEIMQKVGTWEKNRQWRRTEQKITLKSETAEVFAAYQILRTLFPGDNSCYIAQFENYLFQTPDFEIKLTHQFGNSHKYNFEVEVLSSKIKPETLLQDLGLDRFVTLTTTDFWDKWNSEVNLIDSKISLEDIHDLIQSYLRD